MTSPLLPKWKKNQIFEAIKNAGLDPTEFDLKDVDAEVRIKHKWSESYFIIGGDPGHYVGRYVIGDGSDWRYEAYSWESVMPRVSSWLQEVKHDLETPDLWAELQRDAELLGDSSNEATENIPFAPEEQRQIAEKLKELAEYARLRHALSVEQMGELNVKINYLIGAAGRLGRTDWRGVFVGVIVSYILTVGIPPESARSIFLTFMTLLRTIGHLLGH